MLDSLGPQLSCYLVGDGRSGYGSIAKKRPGIIEAGCWAHALRKCREALNESPAGAVELLALVRTLFRIETQAAEQNLDTKPDGGKCLAHVGKEGLERCKEDDGRAAEVASTATEHDRPSLTQQRSSALGRSRDISGDCHESD